MFRLQSSSSPLSLSPQTLRLILSSINNETSSSSFQQSTRCIIHVLLQKQQQQCRSLTSKRTTTNFNQIQSIHSSSNVTTFQTQNSFKSINSINNNLKNNNNNSQSSLNLPPYMKFKTQSGTSHQGHHQSSSTIARSHSTIAWSGEDFVSDTDSDFTSSITATSTASRPLVLLFAWMLSRNVHIEKYREFWMKRGYDILTVQTSPLDLLIPSLGGRRVASNVYTFLSQIVPQYDQVLVHAFSVGGYQLGEFLARLYEGIQQGDPNAERLFKSLRGFLIDSVVFAEDAAPGLSRAITLNPMIQPMLQAAIAGWLKMTGPITYNRYKKVEAHIIDNERHVPAMLLFSKDDVVSNYRSNFSVVESWQRKGITTRAQCWDRSAHVLHYREHPEEYSEVVDRFVAKLDITKAGDCL